MVAVSVTHNHNEQQNLNESERGIRDPEPIGVRQGGYPIALHHDARLLRCLPQMINRVEPAGPLDLVIISPIWSRAFGDDAFDPGLETDWPLGPKDAMLKDTINDPSRNGKKNDPKPFGKK